VFVFHAFGALADCNGSVSAIQEGPCRRVRLPIHAIGFHNGVVVEALDLKPAKAGGGGDEWFGTSCAKAKVAIVDEVTVR
jgi:hypothetical protein